MEDVDTGSATHASVTCDGDTSDGARDDEAGVPVDEARVRADLDDLALRVTHLAGCVETASGAWARPDLASALASCQGLINTLTAVQDVAITRLAAIEEEWLEDGLVVESRRAPGHIALDAPDVVAGALRVSHLQAQRRVSTAVRLVSDGLDVSRWNRDVHRSSRQGPHDLAAKSPGSTRTAHAARGGGDARCSSSASGDTRCRSGRRSQHPRNGDGGPG